MRIRSRALDMVAGDTRVIDITVYDSSGVVVDITTITAATFQMVQRGLLHSEIEKTLVSGIAVSSGVGGILAVTLLPADTKYLSGLFDYRCRITDSSGNVTVVAEGIIDIYPAFSGEQ